MSGAHSPERCYTTQSMPHSTSFELVNPTPDSLAQRCRVAADAMGGTVSGGIVFLCGSPAREAVEAAHAIADSVDTPLIVACGSGVVSQHGEHEDVSAATGLLWRGGACSAFGFDVDEADDETVSRRILSQVEGALGKRGNGAVVLFAQPEALPASSFDATGFPSARVQLFGGGVVGAGGAVVAGDGPVRSCSVVGLIIRGLAQPVVRASTACRLLGDLQPVTQSEGALILRIGSRSAIDELKDQAMRSERGDLLMVAVEVGRDEGHRPRLMMRGIRGIHETRGGLVVSDEIGIGTPIAFAVRDGTAARADLEATLRDMERNLAGSVPMFGLYFDCAGRGSGMYGVGDVDVAIIRNRWPSLPFAGLKSPFEIGPGRRGPAIHLYSGVLSLFCSPS